MLFRSWPFKSKEGGTVIRLESQTGNKKINAIFRQPSQMNQGRRDMEQEGWSRRVEQEGWSRGRMDRSPTSSWLELTSVSGG